MATDLGCHPKVLCKSNEMHFQGLIIDAGEQIGYPSLFIKITEGPIFYYSLYKLDNSNSCMINCPAVHYLAVGTFTNGEGDTKSLLIS